MIRLAIMPVIIGLMEKAHEYNIVLTTLNARYMHTAFGLRYLYANLGELQSSACIEEFTI